MAEEIYCSPRFSEQVRTFWKANDEGRPTYRVHLLLDHWYLKSWFSSRTTNGPRKINEWSGVIYNGQDIDRMKVKELRCALVTCGMSAQGKKPELAARLVNHVRSLPLD